MSLVVNNHKDGADTEATTTNRVVPTFSQRRLGEILIEHGYIDADTLKMVLATQVEKGGRVGEILLSQKLINEHNLITALGEQLGIKVIERIEDRNIPDALIAAVPINFAKQYRLLPLGLNDEGRVKVVCNDPLALAAFDDLAVLIDAPVEIFLATSDLIIDAINRSYDRGTAQATRAMDELADEELETFAQDIEEAVDLLDSADEAPIIRLVNSLISQAVKEHASDIHIEPAERDIIVRFRVDGILHEKIRPPKKLQASVISRIKIQAGLNIAEKRLPQDGRIRIKIAGKDIDIRVATAPTAHGERITMRLLDRSAVLLDLVDLGFSPDNFGMIKGLIKKSHGIILVTGPTGSGKTTTLYAGLSAINTPDLNILTIEDPIEYQLAGVSQTQVNSKIHLTFSSGLRSFLRHDPDVIMVGEIRDFETAEIAIQAALTGHLVLSTVHTNDAPGAITRLVDMGVEPFLVASSIVGIVAQRLVRTLCPHCKEPYTASLEEIRELGLSVEMVGTKPTFWRGKGCHDCLNMGYIGRTGIYEMMMPSDSIRQLILQNVDSNTIKKQAITQGMRTLREDGASKVLAGITSSAEVLRVTAEDAM
ncbi:MAG: type II secretion system ATPase GspE [Deltaproteobacteria bacterium]|nr:type II secretion system ATPase GspE [Deltaproteobacteria bacterium]